MLRSMLQLLSIKFIVCGFQLCLGYTEIHHIKDLLPFADGNDTTLFVFDIDNTLIEPVDSHGSDQWFSALIQHCTSKGLSEKIAFDMVLPPYYEAQRQATIKTVETDTAEVVAHIQAKNRIICLTARSGPLVDLTSHQLHSVNLHFSKNNPKKRVEIAGLQHPCIYTNGILFIGNNDKGKTLKAFCEMHRISPTRLIFIDDKIKYVQSIEAIAGAMAIPQENCHCFHYTHLREKVQSFVLHDDLIPSSIKAGISSHSLPGLTS